MVVCEPADGIITPQPTLLNGWLEHFNIFCSSLGRCEDKTGKEENAALLVVRSSISDAASRSRSRHKENMKN